MILVVLFIEIGTIRSYYLDCKNQHKLINWISRWKNIFTAKLGYSDEKRSVILFNYNYGSHIGDLKYFNFNWAYNSENIHPDTGL